MPDQYPLNAQEVESFRVNGYVIKKQLLSSKLLKKAQESSASLEPSAPYELETTVGYPGAPESELSEGGETTRRLLSLVSRHPFFKALATTGVIASALEQLFATDTPVLMNPNHHNCLMTKAPSFSSDTGWHQDVRYWHFTAPNLISAWVALGDENAQNGALQVIPKSHAVAFGSEQFDSAKFFIEGHPQNKPWVDKAKQIELAAGDVLFFDSRLLHRASRNRTNAVKYSLVFTYHDASNKPITNTRSAHLPELTVSAT